MTDQFWKSEPGWVLLRTDSGFLPYDTKTRTVLVIEDDAEYEATQQAMLHDGVPILDEPPKP